MIIPYDEEAFHFRFPIWLAWKPGDVNGSYVLNIGEGEFVVPFFTEKELAQTYLDADPPDRGFSLRSIDDPSVFRGLLTNLEEAGCVGICMDPLASGNSRIMPISEVRKSIRAVQ